MNILLVHQNFPGQYKHFAEWLGKSGRHRVVFITQRKQVQPIAGVTVVRYTPAHKVAEDAYALSRYYEECCAAGFEVVQVCKRLEAEGFVPDLIVGHCGWGEMLFLKDVWPDVPMVCLFEYFFTAKGGMIGFDPAIPATPNSAYLTRARNAVHYMSLGLCDAGHVATQWQLDTYPKAFHDKVAVIHEGIRTDILKPDGKAHIKLGRIDRPITRESDEVFTYMARNLEPARGFHQFMRALPHIQRLRPNARAVVIGASGVSYGNKASEPGGFRAMMEKEVGQALDWERIHFVGQVPYEHYVSAMRVSRCHIYLTVPFVLSWSLLEVMAMETTVVASDTAPVREVMEDGRTGFLVDYFSAQAIAGKVAEVLAHKDHYRDIGRAARRHVVANYDFARVCLPRFLNHLNALLPRRHQLLVDE
jgi:glycosyltransferase involved in cell wall biosynthesis